MPLFEAGRCCDASIASDGLQPRRQHQADRGHCYHYADRLGEPLDAFEPHTDRHQHHDSDRHWNAAHPQSAHYLPVNIATALMDCYCSQFSERRKPQVGRYRRCWRDAKEQNENGRHQRAATNTSESNDAPSDRTCDDE